MQHLPIMPGISKKTAPFLKFKSLKYLITHDEKKIFKRFFFKHPIRYSLRLLKSALKKKAYTRQGDLFLYNVSSQEEYTKLLQNPDTIFVSGYSYCHKPFKCPSGRFTPDCVNDKTNPTCASCFIGKCADIITPLLIPTIHYIGEKMFEITEANPGKQVVFLITACELTLEMFGDWGNMLGAKGIGVRLDGRICNTMKAFELSERGIKPGLTVVLDPTQEEMLKFLRIRKATNTMDKNV